MGMRGSTGGWERGCCWDERRGVTYRTYVCILVRSEAFVGEMCATIWLWVLDWTGRRIQVTNRGE